MCRTANYLWEGVEGTRNKSSLRSTVEVTENEYEMELIKNRRNCQIKKLMKNDIVYQTTNATVNT